jgi:hypothetical protein
MSVFARDLISFVTTALFLTSLAAWADIVQAIS